MDKNDQVKFEGLHECECSKKYNNDDSNGYGITLTKVYECFNTSKGIWNIVITGSPDGPIFIPIIYCPFCGLRLDINEVITID